MELYRRYLLKYKWLFFTAVTFVFFEALCDLLLPTLMARIIDEGIKRGDLSMVLKLGMTTLGITAVGAFFATVRSVLASSVSQKLAADLREDLFAKILHFSETSSDRLESGSLITRMTNDTSQAQAFINGLMRIFFKAPVTGIGSILLAVHLSPQMSLILLVAVAIVTVFIVVSMRMSYLRFAKVQYAIDKINTVVQEYLLGIRVIKAFGRYQDEETKFEGANQDLAQKSISSQIVIAYFSPLMTLTISAGIILILYIGSLVFESGEIEVGKVAAFITYMTQILSSLIMITNVFNMFVRTKASTERINEILNSELDFPGAISEGKSPRGDLCFKDVTFAYPGGSGLPALRNLSFRVNPGETLAIIGPTGSGKSTLSWLSLRFYDVDKGSILFNGADIRELDVNRLREDIAIAPQKSMLFSGTVYDNIAWGNPTATFEEILEAARLAQADEFISAIPEGYDGLLGRGGVNLSGGQKQRISLARALLKKSPVLILDDCTSALDAITEAKVRKALKNEAERTVLLITQRISNAISADKILVLDKGESVGFGTHEQLLLTCPTYKEIYDSQIGTELKGYNDGN